MALSLTAYPWCVAVFGGAEALIGLPFFLPIISVFQVRHTTILGCGKATAVLSMHAIPTPTCTMCYKVERININGPTPLLTAIPICQPRFVANVLLDSFLMSFTFA